MKAGGNPKKSGDEEKSGGNSERGETMGKEKFNGGTGWKGEVCRRRSVEKSEGEVYGDHTKKRDGYHEKKGGAE